MSLLIPVSRSFFSLLQYMLKPGAQRITLIETIKGQLKDFLFLSQDVKNRPTHIGEIVPTPPTYYGAADVAKPVMGVYGSHMETLNPSQFVHQLVVESRHHVFGDSDLNPIYKRRLYPNRILPSLSPIVISSLQAPSRRRTFFPMQHLSLTSLPVPSPITILS